MNKKLDYMNDERSIWKFFFLDLITFGVYQHICVYTISRDLKKLCKESNVKFPAFWRYIVFSVITLGIYSIFWWMKIIKVISEEGRRRGVKADASPGLFVACYILRYICSLAILVSLSQIFGAMNKLAADYNVKVRTLRYESEYAENSTNQ
jgi:hypothetical protein